MPDDKDQTNFIQQKNDYENVCEAWRTLRILLQNRNIPIFDNVKIALEVQYI
jgi:hypothetical protein